MRRKGEPAAKPRSSLSLPSTLHTLDNGLRIVVVPQEALHRATVGLFVGVGSRFETRETNGISHFLEHMLYRGTAKHPSAHLQNYAFERLGGTLYAATAADHTYVGVNVPPDSLRESLQLLGEVVRGPRLGEIELEKRIVREEIMEDLDEDGRQIEPDNVTRAVAFRDHPLGFPITGPLEALDRFDDAMLRTHLKRYWVARNMVLAVAGACDEDEVLATAKKAFGAVASGEKRAPLPFSPEQHGVRRKHVPSPGSQTDLRISFLTPGEKHAMAPAIDLLLRVLDDGMSTRLYHRLCDDGGLVYDTHAEWEVFADCGILDVTGEVQHERLPEVVKTILQTLAELATVGPTKQEIEKARARHRWGVSASLDVAEDLLSLLGGAVFHDRPRSLETHAAKFDSLSVKDVQAAAKEVFRRDRMQFVTVGTLRDSVREKVLDAVKEFGR